jgi:hypothetical protein
MLWREKTKPRIQITGYRSKKKSERRREREREIPHVNIAAFVSQDTSNSPEIAHFRLVHNLRDHLCECTCM